MANGARSIVVLALAALCLLGERRCNADDASPDPGERLFTLKVFPLLKQKCFGCHGDDQDDIQGQFDIRSRDGLLAGGESDEPAIVAGNPSESPLYRAVLWTDLEMPPKENDRLTKQEIEWVRDWITAGVPWPDARTQELIRRREWSVIENEEGIIVATSGGLSDEWTYRRYEPEDIWAFRPVKSKDQLAKTQDEANPIDLFLSAKLDKIGLTPAPQADPRTLIRRATYDLTGLPPRPEEILQFLNAWAENPNKAWSALIARLLKSPHYGERWGQHWLDVVRYADTAGFSNDYERSNAWRYRDYVIRSFNDDKPFDEFIIEQIAGDELRPDDPEAIVATGFLRMGPWGTAMIPPEEARQLYLDDLVHNVGQTFLSMPMRCCKCHDHKFDPLPTRDYYRIYAAFSATQPAEVSAAFLDAENCQGFAEKQKGVEALLNHANDDRRRLVEKRETAAKRWFDEHGLPYKNEKERRNDPDEEKPPRHVGLDHVDEGTLKVREQDVWIWERRLERYQPLAQSVYNGPDFKYNGRKLRKPRKIDHKWRPASFILGGGALDVRLEAVVPGVLSATGVSVARLDGGVADVAERDPYVLPNQLHFRRLALAKWIADPRNPLTARSMANRIWQYHFGYGIVRTPNNFGAKGSKPTHPDLLDWLAADFVEHDWKIKRLHQLIMSSAAYCRSGHHAETRKLATVDPKNELLARFAPRRLTAEELRDSMLSITGELNPEMGGVPIMPEINMEVALQPRMIQFSIAPAHQPSRSPGERNRRSIYAYRVRGQADPFLEIMNLPNPNESCQLRETAAVTPQAFTLMNSDVVTDRSIAFALRLQNERQDASAQIRRAFRLAYGRVPREGEQKRLSDYLAEMQQYHEAITPQPVQYPTKITRSLVEEFSGKPFEYTEWLPVYEDYIPDAKPWTVDASTRALADVCLLLINSNEFMYVY